MLGQGLCKKLETLSSLTSRLHKAVQETHLKEELIQELPSFKDLQVTQATLYHHVSPLCSPLQPTVLL